MPFQCTGLIYSNNDGVNLKQAAIKGAGRAGWQGKVRVGGGGEDDKGGEREVIKSVLGERRGGLGSLDTRGQ